LGQMASFTGAASGTPTVPSEGWLELKVA
jgi:hypothetical protein